MNPMSLDDRLAVREALIFARDDAIRRCAELDAETSRDEYAHEYRAYLQGRIKRFQLAYDHLPI